MPALDYASAAAAGAVCLALASALWALAQRRGVDARLAELRERLAECAARSDSVEAAVEAFDNAIMTVQDGVVRLASGAESLAACARVLGAASEDPAAILQTLVKADPDHARRLRGLVERGEPCSFEARGSKGAVVVEGRASGGVAWVRLSAGNVADLPSAARFAAFLDAQPVHAWIRGGAGRLIWANAAWLEAAGAESVEAAARSGAAVDRAVEAVLADAAQTGARQEAVRTTTVKGQRRAFQVVAQPLEGGGAAAMAFDATPAEDAREALKRYAQSHDDTLNRLDDAVAIFGANRRLAFFNTAFAELWGVEPAWLGERPTHGEVLDRLRQRRRLPATADYSAWKARELGFHETLDVPPDELWSVPGGRTLRVVRQPYPLGGLLILFSDITDEVRLKAQYNAQIGVQQATLDKLKDAVAVFGSDGRLRLHNEAFERLWAITAQQLEDAGDFDGVVELCMPFVHDRALWGDLKARVADPDPQARTAVSGETRTSDRRVLAYQSRPLPDGATLVAFSDVTAMAEVERALADREAALAEAERLKRDFVGNVSYELRTPLTTIIGYSELLDRQGDALAERARAHVAAVRAAAGQLAGSIDDVLDIAQIDAGEMALSLGDVPVDRLLQETAERTRRLAEQGRIEIRVACEAKGGVIRADERRLAQMMDHLVANAVRSTPPGGTVTLGCKRGHGEVQLTVTDTGRGIPYAAQAHIFDRFVSRDRGGPGLGLALVKALVELHGGWVALESTPGQGATFTCHLPEKAQVTAAHPELEFSEAAAAGGRG